MIPTAKNVFLYKRMSSEGAGVYGRKCMGVNTYADYSECEGEES